MEGAGHRLPQCGPWLTDEGPTRHAEPPHTRVGPGAGGGEGDVTPCLPRGAPQQPGRRGGAEPGGYRATRLRAPACGE